MKMMLGDMLENVTSGVILQQVNCQGVMGSGIAASIRKKWPQVFDDYQEHWQGADKDKDLLGSINVTEVEEGLYVVNLFAQLHYGRTPNYRYTSYDALDAALEETAIWLSAKPELAIHHPLIGSGLGGGHWATVASLIEKYLGTDTTLWRLG